MKRRKIYTILLLIVLVGVCPASAKYTSRTLLNFRQYKIDEIFVNASGKFENSDGKVVDHEGFDIVMTSPILVSPLTAPLSIQGDSQANYPYYVPSSGNASDTNYGIVKTKTGHKIHANEATLDTTLGAQLTLNNCPAGWYAFYCRGARGGNGNYHSGGVGESANGGQGGYGAAVCGIVWVEDDSTLILQAGKGGAHGNYNGTRRAGSSGSSQFGGGTNGGADGGGGGGGYSGIFLASVPSGSWTAAKQAQVIAIAGGGGGGGSGGISGNNGAGNNGGNGYSSGNTGTGAGGAQSAGANGNGGGAGGGGGGTGEAFWGSTRAGGTGGNAGNTSSGGFTTTDTGGVKNGNDAATAWIGRGGGGGSGGGNSNNHYGGNGGSYSVSGGQTAQNGSALTGGNSRNGGSDTTRGGGGGGGGYIGGGGGYPEGGGSGGGGGGSSYLAPNIYPIISTPNTQPMYNWYTYIFPRVTETQITAVAHNDFWFDNNGGCLSTDYSAHEESDKNTALAGANGYVWICYLGARNPLELENYLVP